METNQLNQNFEETINKANCVRKNFSSARNCPPHALELVEWFKTLKTP